MADYNALKAVINAYIKQNGVQAITGQILNGVLIGMVNALGKGYTVVGEATPSTDPGTMTGPASYIAHTAGVYEHFDNIAVDPGEVAMLIYNEAQWHKETIASLDADATVDGTTGTPSVDVSWVNGRLTFAFHDIKGEQGNPGHTGPAAGFGTPTATVDGNVGTPGVSVSASGPDTAKVFSFQFTNLKGAQGDQGIQGPEGPTGPAGVTSVVVTVDNTSGNPTCTASLVSGVLTLAFTGLKGAQGDTGSSVAYPFTLVNNLTTDDPTQALSAAMGVQLESEISQLEAEINGGTSTVTVNPEEDLQSYRMTQLGAITTSSASTSAVASYAVTAGKTYRVQIPTVKNQYTAAYAFATAKVEGTSASVTLPDPVEKGPASSADYNVTIPDGFSYLIVCYEFADGSPTVTTTQTTTGLSTRVGTLESDVAALALEDVSLDGRLDTIEGAFPTMQSDITDLKGDVADLKEEVDGYEEEVTLTATKSTQNLRLTSVGASTSTSASSSAINCYKVTPGKLCHLEIPTVKNAYTAAFGFSDNEITTSGKTVTLPDPVELGPASSAEYDITIPVGCEYLIVCYEFADGAPTVTTTQDVPGLKEDVETLKDEMSDLVNMGVELSLPDRYVAVIGDTLQIFKRGILKAANPYNYNVLFTCAKGANYPRYWRVYPTNVADVGTYPLTVTVTDNEGNKIAEGQTELVISAAPTSPASAKKFVCFGASTTAHGEWPSECYRRLTGSGGTPSGKGLSNIAFCGPMTKGGAGYFGVGGWSWSNYISSGGTAFRFQVSGVDSLYIGATYTNNSHTYTIIEINVTEGTGNILCSTSSSSNTPTASGTLTKATGDGDATIAFSSAALDASNPFWDYDNSQLDFQSFADTYCGGTIDCMVSLLGWNGRIKYEKSFVALKAQVRTFLDAFHTEFPSAKFIILGINGPSPIGGMGANYGSNQDYSDWYGMTVSALNLKKAYQEIADEDDYSAFVSFVDVAGQFDADYNLPSISAGVNTRNTTQTELVGTNGVHPTEAGYGQIADALYREIVAEFCQSE